MGTSVTVRGYFGLPVYREYFLSPTDTVRECSRNAEHPISRTAKFCSECGSKLEDVQMYTPTQGFAELCMQQDFRSTTDFYDLLYDSCVEPWSDGWKTGDERFGLYKVNVLNDIEPEYYALGYLIGEYWSRPVSGPNTISMNAAEMLAFEEFGVLPRFAELLKISDKPRMFCCAYWG